MALSEQEPKTPEVVIHRFKVSRNLRAEVRLGTPVIAPIHSDVPQTLYHGTLCLVDRHGKVHGSSLTDVDVSQSLFVIDKEDDTKWQESARELLRELHPPKKAYPK